MGVKAAATHRTLAQPGDGVTGQVTLLHRGRCAGGKDERLAGGRIGAVFYGSQKDEAIDQAQQFFKEILGAQAPGVLCLL